ncbi:MAG: hypothetical protein Terrestrivirus8_46 [Terrestrivirus sp.]|uniref:Uncharacterized protein n=1 Tax=Terrestrivirus sp. TaxID=2487775 RepID=A0A3G4ZSI0_9VIRU|nr:MAG: hypothetical protein Terrestrivirus8_46 [Terrestrivirus sp.]
MSNAIDSKTIYLYHDLMFYHEVEFNDEQNKFISDNFYELLIKSFNYGYISFAGYLTTLYSQNKQINQEFLTDHTYQEKIFGRPLDVNLIFAECCKYCVYHKIDEKIANTIKLLYNSMKHEIDLQISFNELCKFFDSYFSYESKKIIDLIYNLSTDEHKPIDLHYNNEEPFISCCENGNFCCAKYLYEKSIEEGNKINIFAQNHKAFITSCNNNFKKTIDWLCLICPDVYTYDHNNCSYEIHKSITENDNTTSIDELNKFYTIDI